MPKEIINLSENQKKIIQQIKVDATVTAPELQQILELSEMDFYNEVRELKLAGILSHVGLTNAGTWVLKKVQTKYE